MEPIVRRFLWCSVRVYFSLLLFLSQMVRVVQGNILLEMNASRCLVRALGSHISVSHILVSASGFVLLETDQMFVF